MSEYDIERLSRLIGMLPPAPAAWVRAAGELPRARRELDGIVARAEADAAFRQALFEDMESALAEAGFHWDPRLIDALRRLDRTRRAACRHRRRPGGGARRRACA